jgi:hypothetical protein
MVTKIESIRDNVEPEVTLQNRIRERAFHLWKAAGEPDGMEVEHWLRAEQEIELLSQEGTASTELRVVSERSTSNTPVSSISG